MDGANRAATAGPLRATRAWRAALLAVAALLVALGWLSGAADAAAASGAGGPDATVQAPADTTIRLRTSAAEVPYGTSVTLKATLVRAGTSTGVRGQSVRFDARPAGTSTWTRVGTATTGTGGTASLRHVPSEGTEYRVRFGGTARWAPSRSTRRLVTVQTRVTSKLDPATIRLGRKATVSGSVRPDHAGQVVKLQRFTAQGWTTVDEATLSSASTYAFTVRPGSGGSFTYRVVKPADADHARGVSARRTLTVRAYVFPIKPAARASYGRSHHDYPATDIFAPCGTDVVAPTAGRIDEVSYRDTWDPRVDEGSTRGGLSISLVGTDGVRYYGSHFATIADSVRPGVRVAAGQFLGTVGNTGSARPTPCHLHFGISPPCGQGDWRVRRGVLYPWPYLDAWRAGQDRSPARAVADWAAANPASCPGV